MGFFLKKRNHNGRKTTTANKFKKTSKWTGLQSDSAWGHLISLYNIKEYKQIII